MHTVQALRLCTGRTAHTESRGIALPFHNHGTRRGWEICVTPRPLFNPGKDSVSIVQEVGWAPGPVWTGAENLALTGIRSPDRPARSQSLYRLSYCGPPFILRTIKKRKYTLQAKCSVFWMLELVIGPNVIINGFLDLSNARAPSAVKRWFISLNTLRCKEKLKSVIAASGKWLGGRDLRDDKNSKTQCHRAL